MKLHALPFRHFTGASVVLLLVSLNSFAIIHSIQFGGSLGYTYSPKSFSATVGDTVEWDGDFTMHPLSSTSVPTGAATWHNASGSSFRYVIAVPGSYTYQCDVHYALGMVGSFTASPSAVKQPWQFGRIGQATAAQIAIRMGAAPMPMAEITLPRSEFVNVDIFDIRGRVVASPVHGMYAPGVHSVPLEPRLPAGQYFARLSLDGTETAATGMIVK